MRLLMTYFIAWLTTIGARSVVDRRSLIPKTLRRKLCEKTRRVDICEFDEMFYPKQIDDDGYSIWSFCKHNPELLFCKWKPIRNALIPVISHESTMAPTRIKEFSKGLQPEKTFKSSPSKFNNNTKAEWDLKPHEHQRVEGSNSIKQTTTEKIEERFDGKLSDDRHITERIEESTEEVFDENIMMIEDNLFAEL